MNAVRGQWHCDCGMDTSAGYYSVPHMHGRACFHCYSAIVSLRSERRIMLFTEALRSGKSRADAIAVASC